MKRELTVHVVLQADKVQFLQHIKDIPSKEARNAEMAVFCGQPQVSQSHAGELLITSMTPYITVPKNTQGL